MVTEAGFDSVYIYSVINTVEHILCLVWIEWFKAYLTSLLKFNYAAREAEW